MGRGIALPPGGPAPPPFLAGDKAVSGTSSSNWRGPSPPARRLCQGLGCAEMAKPKQAQKLVRSQVGDSHRRARLRPSCPVPVFKTENPSKDPQQLPKFNEQKSNFMAHHQIQALPSTDWVGGQDQTGPSLVQTATKIARHRRISASST